MSLIDRKLTVCVTDESQACEELTGSAIGSRPDQPPETVEAGSRATLLEHVIGEEAKATPSSLPLMCGLDELLCDTAVPTLMEQDQLFARSS